MRSRSLKPSRALLRLLERKDFALITVKELRRDCLEDVGTLSAFLSRHVPQGQWASIPSPPGKIKEKRCPP